jgi:hypothetical protein
VIVNKHRPLKPANYVPADLVQPRVALAVTGEAAQLNSTTAAAAERLFAAAAADGVNITLASGYRSYATQVVTYNGWVSSQGRARRIPPRRGRVTQSTRQAGRSTSATAAARAAFSPASPSSQPPSGPKQTLTASASW